MKISHTRLLPIIMLVIVSSCQEKSSDQATEGAAAKSTVEADQVEKDLLARGDKASKALLGSLGPKLKAALQSGGPEHALTICKQLAQPSTDQVSGDFNGLSISRVSLKPRNPENTPDEQDKSVMETWESQLSDGSAVPSDLVRYKNDKTAVFYRPIMTQEVCMKCHGDPSTFSKELVARLVDLYPEDKATGYTVGQLRGAFRIEFTPEK